MLTTLLGLPDIDAHLLLRRRRPPPSGVEYRRVMNLASMGVLSRGEGEREFVVAELNFFYPDGPPVAAKVYADIFRLRSSTVPRSNEIGGIWNSSHLLVPVSSDKSDLTWSDFSQQTGSHPCPQLSVLDRLLPWHRLL